MQLHGVKVFPWEGDSLIGDALAKSGKYEPNVLPRFLNAAPPGDVVLDVGANIGTYALTAAAKVGPSGKVIAVSRSPAMCGRSAWGPVERVHERFAAAMRSFRFELRDRRHPR